MARLLPFLLLLAPAAALAEVPDLPLPANMSVAAEVSFLVAAVAMILMLAFARWLVARR